MHGDLIHQEIEIEALNQANHHHCTWERRIHLFLEGMGSGVGYAVYVRGAFAWLPLINHVLVGYASLPTAADDDGNGSLRCSFMSTCVERGNDCDPSSLPFACLGWLCGLWLVD